MTYAPAPDRLTPASPGQRGDRWSASVKGRRGMIAGCYLLLIVSGALLVAMREINAALSQMRTPGSAGGGALQFPLQADPGRAVEQLRGSWEFYLKQVKPIRLCWLLVSPVDFHVSAPGRTPGTAPEGDKDNPSDVKCSTRTDGGPLVDVLPRTTELVDYLCPTDVPLSTAAHLSARFPFVSPTGRVTRADCDHAAGLVPKNSSSFDIDGGMFDNSGANTASDAWRALAPLAAAGESGKSGPQRCVVPLFLQIDNSDPAEPELGRIAPPLELFAPVKALFGEIGSRETVARAAAKTQFGPPRSPAGSPVLLDGHNVASLWFRRCG